MKISWGKGIAGAYILFVIITLVLVVVMMRKDVDLVTPNYYEKELKYQDQINKINNTNKLKEALRVEYTDGKITLNFPRIGNVSGEVSFYRPSDPKKDFKLEIQADKENKQIVDAAALLKGYWKMKIEWKANGVDYYNEEQLII
jgi:hypothetical protein